jgi:O-acetyl-ADP-ribose deacetylase
MNIVLRDKNYLSGMTLKLVQGDITLAQVDAVVNPANTHLQHGGGLAGLLSRKAGPMLQKESDLWIQEHGPVSHDRPAHTSAGDLPFRVIIHAVGPVWGSGDEETKLRAAVLGAVKAAAERELTSIAFPAISTGIFRFPLDDASRVILTAVDEVCSRGAGTVHQVQIVLFNDRAAKVFSTNWDQIII